MKSVELEKSSVTNEIYFSFVTGSMRAMMAELMNSIPSHRRIISVTVDGFLTDASLDEVIQTGPIATRFKEATERVAPGEPILEVKHRVKQVLSARIRAQFTAMIDPDPALKEKQLVLLAKGNVTPDIPLPDGEISKEQLAVTGPRVVRASIAPRKVKSGSPLHSFPSAGLPTSCIRRT